MASAMADGPCSGGELDREKGRAAGDEVARCDFCRSESNDSNKVQLLRYSSVPTDDESELTTTACLPCANQRHGQLPSLACYSCTKKPPACEELKAQPAPADSPQEILPTQDAEKASRVFLFPRGSKDAALIICRQCSQTESVYDQSYFDFQQASPEVDANFDVIQDYLTKTSAGGQSGGEEQGASSFMHNNPAHQRRKAVSKSECACKCGTSDIPHLLHHV